MRGLSTIRDIPTDSRLPYMLQFEVRHRLRRRDIDAKTERWIVAAPGKPLTLPEYSKLEQRSRRRTLAGALTVLVLSVAAAVVCWLQAQGGQAIWAIAGAVTVVVSAVALSVLAMLWVDRNRPPGRFGLMPVREHIRPVSSMITASVHWLELTRNLDNFVLPDPSSGMTETLRLSILDQMHEMIWEAASQHPQQLERYVAEVLPVRARDAAVLRYISDSSAAEAAAPVRVW